MYWSSILKERVRACSDPPQCRVPEMESERYQSRERRFEGTVTSAAGAIQKTSDYRRMPNDKITVLQELEHLRMCLFCGEVPQCLLGRRLRL